MMVEGDFSNLEPYGQPLDQQVPNNHTINLAWGSKLITRSQQDYFGKGLQVFFPKTSLHANEFLNEIFCNLF